MVVLDELDRLAAEAFEGYVVRKDLARRFQGLYPVPTYVGEFLLGRYCATTDEQEINEGLEIVERLMRERTVRAGEEELFKSNAREHGSIRIIELLTGRLDAATDSYLAELPSLRLNDVSIAPALVRENDRMLTGGFYAEVEVAYVANPGDSGARPFGIISIKPIQLSTRHALEDLATGRGRLTTEQWKALLLRSIGLEWDELSERERDVWLLRMVPFVQRNYNMVEIGPRGTGKSHLFQQVSPYAHLISGGKATVARMFVDNRTKQRGLVCQYDVVCFDEIAGVSFDQKDGVNIMKGYMESGEFSRGTGSIKAEGSIVFNGNFEVDVETQLRESHLFGPLPPDIRNDTAFMDRIHSYVPGWDAPKLGKRFFTNHFGLVNDFLAEGWRRLRDQSRLPSLRGRYRLGDALSGRDTRAVSLTLDGLLKLLYPDPDAEVATADLDWAIELSLEGRRRVKEQQKRIGRREFGATQFSYSIDEATERFVETPEQRTVRLSEPEPAAPHEQRTVAELIEDGESETVEFKASIRYDIETKGANTELIRGPVKTVSAFMNTEGGTLLIGITDKEKTVVGIENDVKTLRNANVDEYERHLRQALIDAFGVEFTPYVKVSFPDVDGVQVCRVDVGTSPKPVFVAGKGQGKEFYIRSGPRSDPLDPEATHGYIEMHWSG
jgi:ATP-dependent Lon protease